jgi:hypothetical protein
MITLLQKTSILDSSFDEEDSHFFLQLLIKKNWNCYSSRNIAIEEVTSAIDSFILLHASVDMPDKLGIKVWTPKPVGAFRYCMDADLNWHHVLEINPFDGYLVQGAYWSNGFYYIVSYQDFLLEANLYVDDRTKEQYNYA